jgi:hypothetical protein
MKESTSFSWRKENLGSIPNPEGLNSGVYIWVLNWLDIPPHLGVSINGKYFSSTIRGPQLDLSVESVWRLCEQKNKPVFFIKLANHLTIGESEVISRMYQSSIGEETCLFPIKKSLGIENENIQTLLDLLAELDTLNLIDGYFKPSFCHMDWVGIRNYSLEDVVQYIKLLRQHEPAT